jgi:hypothetical protein
MPREVPQGGGRAAHEWGLNWSHHRRGDLCVSRLRKRGSTARARIKITARYRGRCCPTTNFPSIPQRGDDFLKMYFFDDLATPNRKMILANIFWGGAHEIISRQTLRRH